ncbi:MAG: F0F1 ATP synthase subunit A [Firmicutes bacterium]|nr:F0F1 ATP synthase subunit A [Bacillota bacterium]
MMLLDINSILAELPAEIYISILVVFIIFVLSLIVFFKLKKANPLKKPKGILLLAEIGVDYFDGMVKQQMGWRFKKLGGYFLAISMYLVLAFIIGLLGVPSPMGYYMVPLSLALFTFLMIHGTSIIYKKWKYFHRYIEPFAPFLPINLLSMWSPIISLSFRLFCNALAGWSIMSLLYYVLGNVSAAIFSFLPAGFNSIFIAPIIASWLHLYFDLFSAVIQTLVFIMLTMIFVAQEGPGDEEPMPAIVIA